MVVSELNKVLPNKVISELDFAVGETDIELPIISYSVSGESDEITTETLSYGTVNYTIKIWADDYRTVLENAYYVSEAMRALGFSLVGTNEMSHQKLICKILNFRAATQFGSKSWIGEN